MHKMNPCIMSIKRKVYIAEKVNENYKVNPHG